ncbi:hypothetical protein SRABI118_01197 [Massilia sp. Bi118]|uniref:hypothetical protein n=1 Tax=Massilia sp. Bi118 TaxID=2822346 RepID=UPI001DAACF4C|nr:hypothetical protein [Massilia sp. Bi118]CAH0179396.1 hypothetical protein SRABI118_01197 [Massilia sp. Bi118]
MTSTKRPTIPLACLLALLAAACSLPAIAAPKHRHAAKAKAQPDVVGDFHALAQQNPWACEPLASAGAGKPWPGAESSCAWQNRLHIQRWSWRDGAAPSCLSSQARWWHWAQAGLQPTVPRSVWDRRWTAQTLHMRAGGEERLLILRRDGKDGWEATEWRWNPNPRPATRRWQEGRWKLLLEAASQPQFRSAAADSADAARMRPIWPRLLGTRPGEIGSQGLALESGGLCLQAGNPLPGQTKLHLSYSPNDSRLEQRAAMHLQLSRQYPEAKWLTQFKMLDMPANLPSGAKFLASWVEGGQVIGQLWMPLKGDATTVRLRVTTPLPPHQGDGMAAAGKIKPVVERELEAIAMQWAAAYE